MSKRMSAKICKYKRLFELKDTTEGKCVGLQTSYEDDEPAERCKVCKDFALNDPD